LTNSQNITNPPDALGFNVDLYVDLMGAPLAPSRALSIVRRALGRYKRAHVYCPARPRAQRDDEIRHGARSRWNGLSGE